MEMSVAAEPAHTLEEVNRLRGRARARAHSGAWFPAAILSGLVLASMALYSQPFTLPKTVLVGFPAWAGLADNHRSELASYLFWFIGTPLVFGVIALWYRGRGLRVGARVAWPFAVGTGLVVLVLLAVLAAMPVQHGQYAGIGPLWMIVLTPLVPIIAAVIGFGIVERSWGMAAAGVWMLVASWPFLPGTGVVPMALSRAFGDEVGSSWDRPGPKLIGMAMPLILFAVISGIRSRNAGK